MQYSSPIKVFSPFLLENENIQDINFTNLKKRILAEFELSGNTVISTGTGEYSKNEIIQLFETIDKNDFEYHLALNNMPELLFLLEHNQVNGKIILNNTFFNDENFIKFLSPYLAHSLGIFYADCVINAPGPISLLHVNNLPILPEHEQLLTEPVFDAIEEIITKIEDIEALFGKTKILPDARIYFKGDIIRALNKLPKQYFSVAIDMFAKCGINFIYEFLRKVENRSTYLSRIQFIYNQLNKLNLNQATKQELTDLDGYLYNYSSAEKSKSSRGLGTVAFIIIGIIVFLIRLSTEDSSRTNFNDYNNLFNSKEYKELLNLDKYLKDTLNFEPIERLKEKQHSLFEDSLDTKLDELIRKADSSLDALRNRFKDSLKIKIDSSTSADSNNEVNTDSLMLIQIETDTLIKDSLN